jgi:hypothetical protein
VVGSAYAGALPRRIPTWIPPHFSSSYLSFCYLAVAAGTAGAAGIKFHPGGAVFLLRKPPSVGGMVSVHKILAMPVVEAGEAAH